MHELPARADGGALETRRSSELTPFERAVRRKNRRWMGVIVIFSVVVGAAALTAAVVAGSGGSPVHPVRVPPGYKAVSDRFFAYAVPAAWTQNNAYTDDVGDLDIGSTSGWAAEHVGGRAVAPLPGEAPPAAFATFGEPRPLPYRLGPASSIQVGGAAVAFRYTLTRAGGFRAVAVDAWQSSSGAEIWLLVRADAGTTSAILSSLNA